MNKKGLSGIVLTVIMIALVLVAVGIVWVVVSNILATQTKSIEAGAKCLGMNFEIESVECLDGKCNLVMKRNLGTTGRVDEVEIEWMGAKKIKKTYPGNVLATKTFSEDIEKYSEVYGVETRLYFAEDNKTYYCNGPSLNEIKILPPMTGLIAYYPFEGDAKDYSGGGKDGTITGATHNSAGGYDGKGAYSFDGGDDYINITSWNKNDLFIGTAVVWVNFNDNNSNILNIKPAGNLYHSGFWISTWKDNTWNYYNLYCGFGNETSEGGSWAEAAYEWNSSLQTGWHQIACQWDNSTGVNLYIDGSLMSSAGASHQMSPTQSFLMGCNQPPDNNRSFNGSIDEVRIYNKALSEEDIKVIYEYKG